MNAPPRTESDGLATLPHPTLTHTDQRPAGCMYVAYRRSNIAHANEATTQNQNRPPYKAAQTLLASSQLILLLLLLILLLILVLIILVILVIVSVLLLSLRLFLLGLLVRRVFGRFLLLL